MFVVNHSFRRLWVPVVTVLPLVACSFLVEKTEVQCSTDADCQGFTQDAHPFCNSGVCVASGLGPSGCFFGTPTTQSSYLNQCTTSRCVPFDNCERLGLCKAPFSLPKSSAPSASPTSGVVNPPKRPTRLCSSAAEPGKIIYMAGAADFPPLLQALQPLLTRDTGYRVVFFGSTSCAGANAIFSPDPTKRVIKDKDEMAQPPQSSYAFFYDDDGVKQSCLLDPNGNAVDVGVSDLFPASCDPSYLSGSFYGEYLGPIVSFAVTVPKTSKQQAISAEALYLIFGLGGKNPGALDASPWANSSYFYIRNAGAASTVLTAKLAYGLNTPWWGVDTQSTDNLRDSLLAVPTGFSEGAIGVLSIDYAEKARGNLTTLYVQAQGQTCGYLPDSTATATDKINVRDGHYPLWGYVHFFTQLNGGVPSAAANAFLTRFAVPKLDQSLVDAIIANSEIPACAMKITRTAELGDFQANASTYQCHCYFESKTTGKASCTVCKSSNDCPADRPSCNYGFCEKS